MLIPKEELNRAWILRKVLSALSAVEAMELLQERLLKTKTNKEFLESMSGGGGGAPPRRPVEPLRQPRVRARAESPRGGRDPAALPQRGGGDEGRRHGG